MHRYYFTLSVRLIGLLLLSIASEQALGETNVTLKATTERAIGGIGTLDRAQYFNHWGQLTPGTNTNLGNLEAEVYLPDGLNTFSGRETNDFLIAMQRQWGTFIQEDPNNPGFFDRDELVSKLQNNTNTWGYKYRVLQSSTWSSLRNAPDPIYVTSGRKGLYPDFIDGGTDLVTNYAGYADLINVYLEEVVYGPNAYLPFDKDRFYVEIMNEPQWANNPDPNWNDVIALHREVTELVKEEHPQAKIGGLGCCGGLDVHPKNNWDRMKQVMDDMVHWETPSGDSVEFDFWALHIYERYSVFNNGSFAQDAFFSPGHVAATMDLYETYSNQLFGDPKSFAITEYGSWNRTNITNDPSTTADDDYGNYSRAEQQWDLVRNTQEKLFVFMDRPDRIVNATPFLGPRHWENFFPTSPVADNVFWEQDANGNWHETIVAGMYRMHNDIRGEYLDIESDNADLQTLAFRDGNKIYVMLNNLEDSSNSINLQAITGSASVLSASLDRMYWNGTQGIYEENLDRTAGWQNLTLLADEGAVLTLTLDGPMLNDLVTNVETYYGDDTLTPIASLGQSSVINILAETENAISAKVRIGFHRNGATLGESFDILVNGTTITVPAGELEYDDSDRDMVSREVDVPLAALIDGNNQVSVDFANAGGELVTAVLEVTKSIGDYSGNGVFDGEDLSLLWNNFGPVGAGSEFDLVADGTVNFQDLSYWVEELRGTAFYFGDFDLDGDVDDDDLAILQSGYGVGTHYGLGDIDLDGDVDGSDFLNWQLFKGSGTLSANSNAVRVPEPSSILLLIGMLSAICIHNLR